MYAKEAFTKENLDMHWKQKFDNVQRTAANSLRYMREQTEKLLEDYDACCRRASDDLFLDTLFFAMANRLENLTYAFCDVMVFVETIEKEPDFETNLSYHIMQCEARGIPQSQDEIQTLNFLKESESAAQDYLNIAKYYHKMLTALTSYGSGFGQIAKSLETYCRNHFPEEDLQAETAWARKNEGKKTSGRNRQKPKTR